MADKVRHLEGIETMTIDECVRRTGPHLERRYGSSQVWTNHSSSSPNSCGGMDPSTVSWGSARCESRLMCEIQFSHASLGCGEWTIFLMSRMNNTLRPL